MPTIGRKLPEERKKPKIFGTTIVDRKLVFINNMLYIES
jgi:hypothetical protein